jgi:N-acetylmuramate 1-kinase
MATRQAALTQWLIQQLGHSDWTLQPQSGDASFRYYFRLQVQGKELIAVDADPNKDNNNLGFIAVTQDLAERGLCVPEILAADPLKGFMLLSFLGETLYQHALTPSTVESLYQDALSALATLQTCHSTTDYVLPLFDDALFEREWALFTDWFCGQYLGISFNATQKEILHAQFELLVANAYAQPQVYVHRDYHARNLIVRRNNNPGIIDYQDAVVGPLTYDLVSLLRDGYVAWAPTQVTTWALQFYECIRHRSELSHVTPDLFLRWFDLMGLQRHLKIIGIFSRKYTRDGTIAYLNEIPRTLLYIQQVSAQYPETRPFLELLKNTILPVWHNHQHPTPLNNVITVEAPI